MLSFPDLKVKIIDFGSSFLLKHALTKLSVTTPEYLAPEVLAHLDSSLIKELPILHPWSIDVWSLGCILLEMVTGIPLWLSYKARIASDSPTPCTTGLFGVQGRLTSKIYLKQLSTVANLRKVLKTKHCCIGRLNTSDKFLDLLSRMLDPVPTQRISPTEILCHPFLA